MLKTKIPPVCAIASTIKTPGITGDPGKCPAKNGSFIVTFFIPITWELDNSNILSGEIIDQKPENLDPYIEIYNEKIILDSLLLNRNDSITIKATINDPNGQMKNFKENIKVDARILGVEFINRI